MEIDTVRVLRQSPGITTTLALSGETRERVVVRRVDLSMTFPWSWHWLEGELEAMRRARLPHVIPTQIAHKGPDHVDLVRPFIAGLDIREWSAQESPQSLDVQLQLMCNLFYALARLHRMGIAHGGVKPANIMLAEGTNQLVLLDASVTRTQLAAVTHPVEGPEGRYLLPESPGLAHPAAGFTADIFAAGWVLLESTAEGNRTASALRRANPRIGTHAELSHLVDIVGLPATLRPIFLKLLSPRAAIRYESADEVLAALEAVVATGGGESALASAVAPPRQCGSLAYVEPPLVGRHDELATLTACADGASRSSGAVTCLSGESGVGKSRLLDAVATHASTAGVTVMRAGAFDHAAARPLGLFAGPFRDVVAYLTAHPREAERVRGEMGELLPAALEQIPELTAAFGDPPAAKNSDSGFGDHAVAAAPTAVARLLRSVFTKEQPGLIVVDDCQWADDLSWQVLAKLASTIAMEETRSQSNVSLICSCRTEAVAQVRAWEISDIEFLDLQPLSAADTEELIRSIGDRIPDEIIPYVTKYSKGNPLETMLVFQALVDSSALTRESGRWVMDENGMASLPLPSQSRDSDAASGRDSVLVSSRLSLLSPDTQQAIRQGAVLGRRFSSRLLYAALAASPTDVDQLLLEATQHGIVRGIADGGHAEFEFTHDRLREAVLRTLTDDARRELHLRAAQALEGVPAVRADYDIAYHFDRSGRAASAVPYALRAGEAGLRHNALDVAEGNFKIAETGLALCESADDTARFRVHEGLGTVHMLLGNYDLAAKELAWAYELTRARSGLDSSRVATLLGELAFKTGRFDDAAEWMRQSMHDIGLRLPRSSILAAVFAVGEVGLLTLGWLSRRIRPGRAGTERDRLAARIHNRLLYEWWFVRSPIWLVLAILRGVRFANAAGSTRERAQAYSTAAVISGVAPVLAPLALRLADRSLRLRQTAGEGWGIAQSHHFRGFVLYAANRYDEAIAAFDTAIAAFDTVGDRWEQVAAMWQKALCLARQGKLHDAGVLARDTYWEGKRRGDRIGAGTALAIWVWCLPGEVSMETISRELRQTNSGDRHTMAMLHAARAWRLFHAEQDVQAVDAFRQADELIRGSGIRNHFLAPILTAHLQVLRLSHDAAPAWWTEERRLQATAARRQLTRARWSAIVFWGERPAVLREWALMSFSRGHKWRGRMILAAASRSAFRYSAQGELAACALVATLVGLTPRRGPLSALAPVTELCRPLGIRVDRGIVESAHSRDALVGRGSARHQALLDAVSSIVASEDIDEVLDKLRDATFATTTARRVEISRHTPVSVDAIRVPNASPASMLGDSGAAGEAREMKLTERIIKPVVGNDVTETAVVAAFPLGESEHHGPTMEVLAALAGAVIEREGLRPASMERIVEVQEAERGRIARDLHDEFGHLFAGVMDGLSALQNSEDATTRQTATDVRTIVRQGIQVARTVAWSLRPSGLDDLGLTGCIEQYVEDCRQMYPIRIELTATGQPISVPPAVTTAVFRIVQEALTNIGRHSRAGEASVMIVSSADTLRAVVEDNGTGFDLDLVGQRRSLGLIGMRERARLVGGRMSVESRPGQGTTIMVEVPIRR
ncbi:MULTISPECIES: AAA family ATPase [Rhodococcus]|uniref:AAA family ATPase n=1 Tax=Rhodococcus TaxID=1827 RepID=UPI0015F4838D|nr:MULTISPECIES: AAA family ATPase [Rhodococcus]